MVVMSLISAIPVSVQPFLIGLVVGFVLAFLFRGFAGLVKWVVIVLAVGAVVVAFLSRVQ